MALDLRVPVETKTQEVFTADAFDLVARERVVRVPESLSLDGGRDKRVEERESVPWPVILEDPEDPVMEGSGTQATSGNDGYEADDEASIQGMRCVKF